MELRCGIQLNTIQARMQTIFLICVHRISFVLRILFCVFCLRIYSVSLVTKTIVKKLYQQSIVSQNKKDMKMSCYIKKTLIRIVQKMTYIDIKINSAV